MSAVVPAERCAHCGKSLAGRADERAFKGNSGTRLASDVWRAHLEADEFCSTECCRAAHGLADGAESPGACVGCGKPFSKMRNGLAGPRCRRCADVDRKRRRFDSPDRCAGCGGDLEGVNESCWHCRTRAFRRTQRVERAAAKSVPAGLTTGSIEPPRNGSPSGGDAPLYAATDAAEAA